MVWRETSAETTLAEEEGEMEEGLVGGMEEERVDDDDDILRDEKHPEADISPLLAE